MSTFEQDASANTEIPNLTPSDQSIAVEAQSNLAIDMTETVENLFDRFSTRNESAMKNFALSMTPVLKESMTEMTRTWQQLLTQPKYQGRNTDVSSVDQQQVDTQQDGRNTGILSVGYQHQQRGRNTGLTPVDQQQHPYDGPNVAQSETNEDA